MTDSVTEVSTTSGVTPRWNLAVEPPTHTEPRHLEGEES